MDKRTIINPGAYSIFIRQMVRDDGLSINEINRGIGWNDYYANTLLKDNKMPTFNNCLKAEAYFKEYFMRSNKFKRHLRKTIQVYEPIDVIDWLESECDDQDLWLAGMSQDKGNFLKSDMASLETGEILFKKLMLFTINIDRYEDSPIGDYIGLSMEEYERGEVG